MTVWHYQVMRYGPFDDEPEYSYGIHEFYVSEDGHMRWTSDAIDVVAESPEEVLETLKQMVNDLRKHGIRDYETGDVVG